MDKSKKEPEPEPIRRLFGITVTYRILRVISCHICKIWNNPSLCSDQAIVHTQRKHDTTWKFFVWKRKPALEDKGRLCSILFMYSFRNLYLHTKETRFIRWDNVRPRRIVSAVLLFIRPLFPGLCGLKELCIVHHEAVVLTRVLKRKLRLERLLVDKTKYNICWVVVEAINQSRFS